MTIIKLSKFRVLFLINIDILNIIIIIYGINHKLF